ncbi:putative competence-damage inducible protein [Botrimarina colliarenosi]|uniref:Putative competence-damage inducible protein n=1 Tax=Botrimarina colliarenosi TaxID=2528001 RepID=A0A5C6AC88_9BACT|nr:molybdopterin-binding protein [Botrimarina colliarenosi]TWT95863.1 putative competence-damage inducible protein [Botrimarina colliarenosi]
MPASETAERTLVAEVIAIGDELTTGQRLDTNTQWLAQRLTDAGLLVRYHTTVADDLQANIEVFQAAAARANVVVATGGLGPTADDLTRDAMAAAAGVPLINDPDLAAHIESIFTSRGRVMPPQNLRQAQLPEHARPIPNPGGTAPGVDQTVGGCRLFALPGVPAEMHDMWAATVAPAITAMTGRTRVTRHWLVKCFGAGESTVEGMLGGLIARGREPLVGITASQATITLRVTASGETDADCYAAMAPTLDEIRTKLGELVYAEQPGGEEEIELHQVVVELLRERGQTLGVSEEEPQGLLAQWLASADVGGEVGGVIVTDASASGATGSLADYLIAVKAGLDGSVPVAVQTPAGSVSKDILLIGHPSIHRALVAKHALNLLRLELLKQS